MAKKDIRVGMEFKHTDYGDVKIHNIQRRIDAVNEMGQTAETLIIEFAHDAGGVGGNAILSHNAHREELKEFVKKTNA